MISKSARRFVLKPDEMIAKQTRPTRQMQYGGSCMLEEQQDDSEIVALENDMALKGKLTLH